MPTVPVSLVTADADLAVAALAVATAPAPGDAAPRASVDERGAALLAALGLDAAAHLSRESAKGEPGEVVVIPVPRDTGDETTPSVVLLAGVGDGGPAALRRAGAAVARKARSSRSARTLLAVGADPAGVRAHAEGLVLGSYYFQRRSRPSLPELDGIELAVDDVEAVRTAFDRGLLVGGAVELARDLVNRPGRELDPAQLAEEAEHGVFGLDVRVDVLEPEALEAGGFGGLLAVGGGSASGPRLIGMEWAPAGATRSVALVGKGITFDTGGLSLKRGDGMVTMKTDMAGGAAVIATMRAVAQLRLPLRVVALVPAAENMPSGSAYRPGDVLTQWGGTTVEVLNTDAEGRLVLADALAYAAARLEPDVLVDLATLTGAMPVALGRRTAGLFASDDALAGELLAASASSGEQLWRMPLVEDYRDALDSPVADLRNIGDPDRGYSGGSITAALFLREFTGGLPWAHLDIAGPARATSEPSGEPEVTKGGTGYGVQLLLHWLEALAAR